MILFLKVEAKWVLQSFFILWKRFFLYGVISHPPRVRVPAHHLPACFVSFVISCCQTVPQWPQFMSTLIFLLKNCQFTHMIFTFKAQVLLDQFPAQYKNNHIYAFSCSFSINTCLSSYSYSLISRNWIFFLQGMVWFLSAALVCCSLFTIFWFLVFLYIAKFFECIIFSIYKFSLDIVYYHKKMCHTQHSSLMKLFSF